MDAKQLKIRTAAEEERIRRIVGGSAEAFRALVLEFHPLAYSLAYKVVGDERDAEEIVQDAFVKIYHALPQFRGDASLKTWILRIVMRLSLNRRRDRARNAWHRLGLHLLGGESESGQYDAPDLAADPEAACIANDSRRLVMCFVDELPAPLREALILNSFEELSYEEISRILDVPVGTVSSRIHAARRKLRGKLVQAQLL